MPLVKGRCPPFRRYKFVRRDNLCELYTDVSGVSRAITLESSISTDLGPPFSNLQPCHTSAPPPTPAPHYHPTPTPSPAQPPSSGLLLTLPSHLWHSMMKERWRAPMDQLTGGSIVLLPMVPLLVYFAVPPRCKDNKLINSNACSDGATFYPAVHQRLQYMNLMKVTNAGHCLL